MTARCGVEREGRCCDLIAHHHGLHMWLNPTPPTVVAWGYTNSDDTNPPGQHACAPDEVNEQGTA